MVSFGTHQPGTPVKPPRGETEHEFCTYDRHSLVDIVIIPEHMLLLEFNRSFGFRAATL